LAQPCLAASSTVAVASGAVLQLDFSVTNTVAGLSLGGVSQAPGVYNSANSGGLITGNGSLKVATTVLTPPELTGGMFVGGGQFQLTFSGASGQTYQVLTSTNVALPLASWTPLTSGTFGASPAIYVDTGATNANRFYRVTSP
jgi:hypothetical protein